MKLLAKYEPERFTTVEFLPFGFDWTHVAEIRFSENKDLPDDNDPPRRQKVRNSTVEGITTVEFLPFGFDWTHVAEIRFSENKGLPVDSDPPRRQKVRNSTVEVCTHLKSTCCIRHIQPCKNDMGVRRNDY